MPPKKTGGNWDPSEKPFYFIAGSLGWVHQASDLTDHELIAVNEINSEENISMIDAMLDRGCKLLIDSGVYSLAAKTAERLNVSHDVALRMPIDKLDGFKELFDRYVSLAKKYQDRAWGIVEVDLGGRDQKRITRKKLEGLGIRAIPVYHPLNDGWDYFDELATNYDRICVGNIVNASPYVRLRILSTIYERRARIAPKLWMHALGLTPNQWLCGYPVSSADSSAWLNVVRWSGYKERACLRTLCNVDRHFQYLLGDRESCVKGTRMGAVGAHCITQNLRNFLDSMRKAGIYADAGLLQNAVRRLPPLERCAG